MRRVTKVSSQTATRVLHRSDRASEAILQAKLLLQPLPFCRRPGAIGTGYVSPTPAAQVEAKSILATAGTPRC